MSGVVAALAILLASDRVQTALYPLSLIDDADSEALLNAVATMPLPANLLTLAGWLASASGGAWPRLRACDRRWAGWAVVAAAVSSAVGTVVGLPHPLWMKVCAIVLPMLGGALAGWAHRKPCPGEAFLG